MPSRLVLPVAVLVLALFAGLTIYRATQNNEANLAGQTAQNYASSTTSWISGPTVRSVRIVQVRDLTSALRTMVPPGIAADVNVGDLAHRVGARHRVALVVLYGVHNSLPPDEGVNVNGDVVAVVDTTGNRVLVLTD